MIQKILAVTSETLLTENSADNAGDVFFLQKISQ